MEIKKIRHRHEYLDMARAIGIILVLLCVGISASNPPTYAAALSYIPVPLFFIISGTVVRRHRTSGYGIGHWKDFLIKNVMTLLVPYFIWAMIFSDFSIKNTLKILFASAEKLGEAGVPAILWFLPCLFCARVLTELIIMSSKLFLWLERHVYAAIIAVFAFAAAFVIPPIDGGYPLCFNVSLLALGFMLFGYAVKAPLALLKEKNFFLSVTLFLVCSGAFAAVMLLCGDDLKFSFVGYGKYGDIPLFLISSVCGAGAVLIFSVMISMLCSKKRKGVLRRIVLWIGKNTMGIFILFMPLTGWVIPKTAELFGLSAESAPVTVVGTAARLLICCVLTLIVNTVMPQLFGKERKSGKADTEPSDQTENM